MLAAARLVALTAGCGFSPVADLPWPEGYGERAALAVAAAVVVTGLLVLLVRDDEPRLWLCGPEGPAGAAVEGLPGGVLLPAAALEGAAEEAVAGHPDILRATATARGDARRLRLDLRAVARPLVDEQGVGRELERRVAGAVRPLLAVGELEVRVRVHGVTVKRLARYLP
ncbi:MAG: hypothetical protein V2J16_05610 [Thermoleophilia bacterium]|nr:hypothetical protein [Thermoleophilia bacterium]